MNRLLTRFLSLFSPARTVHLDIRLPTSPVIGRHNPAEGLTEWPTRPSTNYEWHVVTPSNIDQPTSLLGFNAVKAGEKVSVTYNCDNPGCTAPHTVIGTVIHRSYHAVLLGELTFWDDDKWGTDSWGLPLGPSIGMCVNQDGTCDEIESVTIEPALTATN